MLNEVTIFKRKFIKVEYIVKERVEIDEEEYIKFYKFKIFIN